MALSEAELEANPATLIVGGDGRLATRLRLDRVESVAALVARLEEEGTVPARVVFDHSAQAAAHNGAFLVETHAGAQRALSELQFILTDARASETSVTWLTSSAVATGPEEGVAGLSRAPLWGLVRSARRNTRNGGCNCLTWTHLSQRRLCWRSLCPRPQSRS